MADDKLFLSDDITRQVNLTSSKAKEIAATKQFVVNATGNLFVATTLNGGEGAVGAEISAEAEKAFGQVSVFFSAMTKAMSEAGKSLYDYESLDALVSGSGLFVKVTESQIRFESTQWGVTFGNQLIQALLGMSGNLASIGKSLMDMVAGIGKEGAIEIAGEKEKADQKVGTIIFVCEYLLGAVSITPIVFSISKEDASKNYKAGPCFKTSSVSTEMNINKAIYMFVPPVFVEHASSLNEAMNDPEFINLVESLKKSIATSAKK